LRGTKPLRRVGSKTKVQTSTPPAKKGTKHSRLCQVTGAKKHNREKKGKNRTTVRRKNQNLIRCGALGGRTNRRRLTGNGRAAQNKKNKKGGDVSNPEKGERLCEVN